MVNGGVYIYLCIILFPYLQQFANCQPLETLFPLSACKAKGLSHISISFLRDFSRKGTTFFRYMQESKEKSRKKKEFFD